MKVLFLPLFFTDIYALQDKILIWIEKNNKRYGNIFYYKFLYNLLLFQLFLIISTKIQESTCLFLFYFFQIFFGIRVRYCKESRLFAVAAFLRD